MDHQQYLAKRIKGDDKARLELFEEAKALENEDRRCFSQTRDGWEVAGRDDLCQHPHKSLVPLFDQRDGSALKEAFSVDPPSAEDADRNKRVFTLNRREREEKTGKLSVVPNLAEFKSTFLDIFCEGQLRYLNWDNVFAAGGGVLACAQPVPAEHAVSTSTKRKYFHDLQYSSSDVDLFLYGLNEEQARKKLVEIYRAVCESNPHTVVCFRSAHAVTLVSQYPFRHIQIVLRLYSSPYEVLAGFDVDACTIGFDGKMVYADVRAHNALVTCRNTIDVTRRSPSYEMRLAKYGVRGFEVEVRDLKRDMVDPGIFERPWNSLDGLAKLLVLERLRTPEQRHQFFEMQKLNRGGMRTYSRHYSRYDSATQERLEEKLGGTAEVSNYSTVFLPWGLGHTAESTMRLMAKKDQKLNSSWFMRDRSYRLHPCFFGTAEEVVEDCSKDDPPFPPKKEGEDAKMREHRETYVRGPLQFIVDDPGRQRIGSFHPLSEVGWAEGVYFHSSTEELFAATNADDASRVKAALEFCVTGPDCRDFFGRTALHLALMSGSFQAMKVLLENGASPLEPMAGGRTVFHLAAIYNHHQVIPTLKDYAEKKLLKQAEEQQSKEAEGAAEAEQDAMDVDADQKLQKKTKAAVRQLIRARDGDSSLSPLQLALVLGNLDAARALLKAGATAQFEEVPVKPNDSTPAPQQLVGLLPTKYLEDGIKLLVEFGFSASERYASGPYVGRNAFFDLVEIGDELGVEMLLKHDPTAVKAVTMLTTNLQYPLFTAVSNGNVRMVKLLLDTKKCPTEITQEMIQAARSYDPNNYYLTNFTGQIPLAIDAVQRALDRLLNSARSWGNLGSNSPFVAYYGNGQRGKTTLSKKKADGEEDEDTIDKDKLSTDLDVSEEDLTQIAEMLAKASDVSALIPTMIFSREYRLRSAGGEAFDSTYWRQREKLVQGQPDPAISASDYASFFVGKLERALEVMADKEKRKEPLKPHSVSPSTLSAICQELEAQLKSHPRLQQTVRGWRAYVEATSTSTAEDATAGLDPDLARKLEKLMKEKLEKLRARMDRISKAFKCTKAIEKYSRDSWKRDSNNNTNYNNNFGGHFGRRQAIPIANQNPNGNPFPSSTDLFFTKSDVEKDVRNFLIANEKRYPAPSPFPQNIKKAECLEPWAIAGLQRSLFQICARSYMPMSTQGAYYPESYWTNTLCIPEYPKSTPGRVLGFPKPIQEQCSLVFAQCRRGIVDGLEELAKEVPMASLDLDGCTPLTMAVLSGNVECIKEVLRICDKQFVRPNKEKKAAAPARIDNFELMQELEEEGSEAEEENSEDEEDDDDEADEDDEDEDDAPKKRKNKAVPEPLKAGESNVKPTSLFCMVAAVYLDSHPLYKLVEETRDDIAKRKGYSAVNSVAPGTHFLLTPLQLAIVLGDVKVFETLLNEARAISPQLLRSILLHRGPVAENMINASTSWELAVRLDRSEMLQIMVATSGIALNYEDLATRLQVQPWKYRIEEATGTGGATKETSKKTKKAAGRYTGLQSSLFGDTKRRNEMLRDPRLSRMERLPHPERTLLHVAAGAGASKCFKLLSTGQGLRKEIEQFLASSSPAEIESIRELWTKARERTPKAFMGLTDVDLIEYFFIGKDDTVADRYNMTPLHHAVVEGTLGKLLKEGVAFSTKCLNRSYAEVRQEDQIRFTPVRETALGEWTTGGSPLSLAISIDDAETAVELMDKLHFDPNVKDAYSYGMNAFHLALYERKWKVAKVVGERMDPGKLLEPNEFGITPLMIAAKTGTVEALLAAVSACKKANAKQIPQSAMVKDDEGHLALHFAANSRFSETLKTVMDWTVEQNANDWLAEEFASGRTPLDDAIAVVVVQEMSAAGARRTQQTEKQTREQAIRAGKLNGDELKFQDHIKDGREVVEMLRRGAQGKKRVRASFQQVRPAREKRLDMIAAADAANEVIKLREDITAVWPNAHENQRNFYFAKTGYSRPAEGFVLSPFSTAIEALWQ